MSALSPLQEQAIRLMRTKWGSDADLLAQELFLILSQDANVALPGAVTTTPSGGITSTPWPNLPTMPPFPIFPDITFPEVPIDAPLQDDQTQDQPGGLRKKTQTIPLDRRTTVPAQIASGTGNSYTVNLYPNGSRATGADGTPLVVSESATCDQIDPSETIPSGTWVWVYRYSRVNAIVTSYLAQLPSGPWVEVSRSTQYKVVSQTHEIILPVWLNG